MLRKDLHEVVHVGVGARDGDRLSNLTRALELLSGRGVTIEAVSSVYETEPVDLPGDTPLLNGAASLRTTLDPGEMLAACLEVERVLGRRRLSGTGGGPDTGPRPIDLDLLLCGARVLESEGLTVPHPRLHLRRFVLVPLAEIAPSAVHPVLGTDILSLSERCPDTARVVRSAPPAAWWPSRKG